MTTSRVLYVVFGLVLLVLAVPLMQRKIPRNLWYGVRLRLTLQDETAWYDINAYVGRFLAVGGAVIAMAGVLLSLVTKSPDVYSSMMVVVMLMVSILSTILSISYIGQYVKDHNSKV